jgi:hypothetical protein
MTQFVYHADGHAKAFIIGKYIYDLGGEAVGRVSGTRLYRLDGSYVGELFRDMAVQKPVTHRFALQPVDQPPAVKPPIQPMQRTPVLCEFPDAFHLFAGPEELPPSPPQERPPLDEVLPPLDEVLPPLDEEDEMPPIPAPPSPPKAKGRKRADQQPWLWPDEEEES